MLFHRGIGSTPEHSICEAPPLQGTKSCFRGNGHEDAPRQSLPLQPGWQHRGALAKVSPLELGFPRLPGPMESMEQVETEVPFMGWRSGGCIFFGREVLYRLYLFFLAHIPRDGCLLWNRNLVVYYAFTIRQYPCISLPQKLHRRKP